MTAACDASGAGAIPPISQLAASRCGKWRWRRRCCKAPKVLQLVWQHTHPHRHTRAGISLKTQELYALVFIMRYLDVFTSFISLCAPPSQHSLRAACAHAPHHTALHYADAACNAMRATGMPPSTPHSPALCECTPKGLQCLALHRPALPAACLLRMAASDHQTWRLATKFSNPTCTSHAGTTRA